MKLMPVILAALLAAAGAPAFALSDATKELIEIDRKLADERCREERDYITLMAVAGLGHEARAREIEAGMRAPRTPEREAIAKRRQQILETATISREEMIEYGQARQAQDDFCPYSKEDVPYNLPRNLPPKDARDAALALAPRALAKMRLCEVFFPARRGSVEKAWAQSAFSKADWPELQAKAREVREWLKEDLGPPRPGSKLERDLKDPGRAADQAAACDRSMKGLARVEAAMPAGFLAKPVR